MWLYRINHALGPLIGSYWRLRLEGEVDRIPRNGPLIVAANHASFLDPWLIGMAFPRPVRYLITRSWYEKSPVWRAVFRAFGTEPVRAEDPLVTVDAVCELLARGEVVGIFPEGSISPTGKLRRFRSGIARIAARSGAPVLPVGIRGGFESLPRHRLVPRPSRVRIRIGEPMTFAGFPRTEDPDGETLRAFRDELFARIRELCGQDADGHGTPTARSELSPSRR